MSKNLVAPPAGAWIETISARNVFFIAIVAPPAGAWIETTKNMAFFLPFLASRPLRARGLKRFVVAGRLF